MCDGHEALITANRLGGESRADEVRDYRESKGVCVWYAKEAGDQRKQMAQWFSKRVE